MKTTLLLDESFVRAAKKRALEEGRRLPGVNLADRDVLLRGMEGLAACRRRRAEHSHP